MDMHACLAPKALLVASRWAKAHYRFEEWEDLLHDAIVKLLERHAVPITIPFQVTALKWAIQDAWRVAHGDPTHSLGEKRLTAGERIVRHPRHASSRRVSEATFRLDARLDVHRWLIRRPAQVQRIVWAWACGDLARDIAAQEGLSRDRIYILLTRWLPGWRAMHTVEHPAARGQRRPPKTAAQREASRRNLRHAQKARWARRQAEGAF